MTPAAIADCVDRARDGAVCAARRRAAFEELVVAFDAMALTSAIRVLHDVDDAQEVAQDAFLAAWLKLDQLRVPAAFGGWLKRLVATECHRRLRRHPAPARLDELPVAPHASTPREPDWPLDRALAALTAAERQAIVLFYVQGCTLDEIAARAGAPPATIGKRLYAARLKIRRTLPRSVRVEALRARARGRQPGPDALADYIGPYRFDERPELVVEIQRSRQGDFLVSSGQGQRHALLFIGDDALATQAYDGEGYFQRDRRGRVARFVYYEFGARLGVARKVRGN